MQVTFILIVLITAGQAFPTNELFSMVYSPSEEATLRRELIRPLSMESIRDLVYFDLYTRQSPDEPELIDLTKLRTLGELPRYFDRKIPTKICIHGWQSDGSQVVDLRKAYLKHGPYNVISMNWTLADTIVYPVARLRVSNLGLYLAEFIDTLSRAYRLDMSSIHIVGHSMGAHLAGIAGLGTQSGYVGRITGLDPAGPFFVDALDRLTYKAATFVDIIHTCGNVFGVWKPEGHADFYPNGGICVQRGCLLNWRVDCSHGRAYDYFIESVNGEVGFDSLPYTDGPAGPFPTNSVIAYMGEHVTPSTRGVYYLVTAGSAPFALGREPFRKPPFFGFQKE